MKKIILLLALAIMGLNTKAQFSIQDDSTYNTLTQMLLANELFESGEPFAESLGYNLDDLDPMLLDSPDSISYVTGIESYEYSRYLLNTLTGRSAMGLHMMWSPVVMNKAATQPASFDGMFTGGTANGYKEDDMLMMMIGNFGNNANQTPPANAFPQFADFIMGNTDLPQTVAADFQMDFGTTRWDRNLMDKTLNLGAMGQSMLKQYFWAQDMLGAFHDSDDVGIDATGSNSPDLPGSPDFDPDNNIFYGGNNLDGYIGQVLTAVSINKTMHLINNLAYDGTDLGAINPATYDPADGIQYFPTKIGITEELVLGTLPPKAATYTVDDENSMLFDQISYLLATTNFKNMMNPDDNSDSAHLAYHEVFDGFPFPAAMSQTGNPGPFDMMMGTGKIIFLNLMAMHYNSSEGTFVNSASLDGSGQPVMSDDISLVNASYMLVALAKFATEYAGTPLQPVADASLIEQADFIINNLKDTANGGYFNSYTIGSGADTSAKTLMSNAAVVRGLYAAYQATNNATYLTEANNAYTSLITNFYIPEGKVFKTLMGDDTATYTPHNLAILTGALREAGLIGGQAEASIIYSRVFKTVFNKMILAEAEASGETGGDSDGDGIPYIAGGNKPFVFAAEATLNLNSLGIENSIVNMENVVLYPNPASEYVSLDFSVKNNSTVQISVIDMLGRIAYSKETTLNTNNNSLSIPLSAVTSGNYLVKILTDNNEAIIKKLIVVK